MPLTDTLVSMSTSRSSSFAEVHNVFTERWNLESTVTCSSSVGLHCHPAGSARAFVPTGLPTGVWCVD